MHCEEAGAWWAVPPGCTLVRAHWATLSHPHLTFIIVGFCFLQAGWLHCSGLYCLVPTSGSDPGRVTGNVLSYLQEFFWLGPVCPLVWSPLGSGGPGTFLLACQLAEAAAGCSQQWGAHLYLILVPDLAPHFLPRSWPLGCFSM